MRHLYCPTALAILVTSACGPGAGEDTLDRTGEFYDPATVQRIDLEAEPDDLQLQLDALPNERIYVPATFRWNDIEIKNVGIRYKGNSSSQVNQEHKRSYLIKFSEFVGGQRFLGLRRVALDNAVQFGSLFSERILGDILQELGVTVSRSNYSNVYLNGEYKGVFVNVERIDKSFLERNFDDPTGNLYKADTGGLGIDLTYHGDDPQLYSQAFEIKTNKTTADHTDIVDLIRDIDTLTDAQFATWFNDTFRGEAFLELMPVMLLGGAFDQYTGFNAHNYYLYREPSSGQWTYIVWDLDVGFADNAFGQVPVIDGWDASFPVPVGTTHPLLNRIVEDPDLLAQYRQNAADTLDTYFTPATIAAEMDELFAQIETDLQTDPYPVGRLTVPTDTSWTDVIVSMKAFAELRHQRALDQLADPANAHLRDQRDHVWGWDSD